MTAKENWLAVKFKEKSPIENQSCELEEILKRFSNIFSSSKRCDVGKIKNFEHKIDLIDERKIINLPLRRIPIAYIEKVESLIQEMLNKKIIQKSLSPYNSPIVVAPKKDGQIRLCIDYRKLNENSIRPSFYIPDTQEILEKVAGNRFFTTLDLVKGYHQIPMHIESIEKTAFSTPSGHYEYLRMPFGLNGAPATFQRALQSILSEEHRKICFVYLDDVIIFGKSKEEHNSRLDQVLTKLHDASVKLSKEKCVFGSQEVHFLGHVVNEQGIKTDPEKIRTILEWKQPENVGELVSFLGLASYYRQFVKNFAVIADPLESVVSRQKENKKKRLTWTKEMMSSFNELKNILTTPPILSPPNQSGMFILDTDASNIAIGAVLSQISADGEERVVHYASNRLSKREKLYCTTRKELLSVVYYVKYFRHYLLGKRFIIRTDHKSLFWLKSWKNPSSSQYFNWINQLSEFDFDIEHRRGSDHINADALSRMECCKQCPFKHPKQTSMLNKLRVDTNNFKTLIKAQLKNADEKEMTKVLRSIENLEIIDGRVYLVDSDLNKRLVVSRKDGRLFAEEAHLNLCHLGYRNLEKTLKKRIFWIGLQIDCKKVCENCTICNARKVIRGQAYQVDGLSAQSPFQKVFIDVAGPLPSCSGYKYFLAIIDSFSKYILLAPMKTGQSEEICTILFGKWFTYFGAPQQLHSDRGLNLNSKEVNELCRQFGTIKTQTSPYHPEGNGMCERLIRTVKDAIFCTTQSMNMNWVEVLDLINMSLRGSSNVTLGVSPYEVLFGKKMKLSIDRHNFTLNNEYNNYLSKEFYNEIINKLINKFDGSLFKNNTKLRVGELVMIKVLPVKKTIDRPRYYGPCKICEIKGNGGMLVVIDKYGKKFIRNVRDVKKFSGNNFVPIKYEIELEKQAFQEPFINEGSTTETKSRYPCRNKRNVERYGFN